MIGKLGREKKILNKRSQELGKDEGLFFVDKRIIG